LAGLSVVGEDRLLVRVGEEPVMGSLLERLQAREQAARTRVEALRVEMDRLAERLAAEQELLRRLEITRQTVIEVLAGGDDDGEVGVVVDPVAGAGAAVARVAGQVPVFGQDGDAAGRGVPVAYRDVVEVLADAGPLRARQVCQAVGTGVESRHREGMRIKLKRLVERGWLVETEPGLFACAGGVAAALNGAG
jgi:DNA-binding FadR family transcriptional regulator